MTQVATVMIDSGVAAVAVVDGSGLIGICTDRDITRAVSQEGDLASDVSEYMSESPDVVESDIRVRDAAAWMLETGYRHLPVMDGRELLGIIDIRDILWALLEA